MLKPCCPNCGHELRVPAEGRVACEGCSQRYAVTQGIPDLRWPAPAPSAPDRRIVDRLLAAYDEGQYSELVQIRMENAPTYGDLLGHEVPYLEENTERGRAMVAMFHERLDDYFAVDERRTALDIGCGTGGSLPALAGMYDEVAGLDPSLPDLLIARKTIQSMGLENVRLVQAYAQRIPYPEGRFDYVNALNVLEHVFDSYGALQDCRRVLRARGRFGADSRNRFDLFTPEPHVRVRWVGCLPRRWAEPYVRWRRGVGYQGNRLLSYMELAGALQSAFGDSQRVTFPLVSAYGWPTYVDAWLRAVDRLPLFRALILLVFPSHLALAMKPGAKRE